jgi:hypothetical protein
VQPAEAAAAGFAEVEPSARTASAANAPLNTLRRRHPGACMTVHLLLRFTSLRAGTVRNARI